MKQKEPTHQIDSCTGLSSYSCMAKADICRFSESKPDQKAHRQSYQLD
jgi:hypothetical protein